MSGNVSSKKSSLTVHRTIFRNLSKTVGWMYLVTAWHDMMGEKLSSVNWRSSKLLLCLSSFLLNSKKQKRWRWHFLPLMRFPENIKTRLLSCQVCQTKSIIVRLKILWKSSELIFFKALLFTHHFKFEPYYRKNIKRKINLMNPYKLSLKNA